MNAPHRLSWRLPSTSVNRTIFGILAGLVLTGNAINLIREGLWWVGGPALAVLIPVTVGWVLCALTLRRNPALRDADLPSRPVRRLDLRISTAVLIGSLAAVIVGAAAWAVTGSWKPWAPILCFGVLLTVGSFVERYHLVNRARQEALIDQPAPPA